MVLPTLFNNFISVIQQYVSWYDLIGIYVEEFCNFLGFINRIFYSEITLRLFTIKPTLMFNEFSKSNKSYNDKLSMMVINVFS